MTTQAGSFRSFSEQDAVLSQPLTVPETYGFPSTMSSFSIPSSLGVFSPGFSAGHAFGNESSDASFNGYFDTVSWSNQDGMTATLNDFNSYIQFDGASSNASYPPSPPFDTESLVQSPVSPTFSNAVSASSGAPSEAMSPDASTPSTQGYEDDASQHADSDDILDELLANIEPTADGKYRCADVDSEEHTCDFFTERKCMLRKHLESTLKTNVCRHPDCNGMQFSSKAVLTRHEKEAHGMHAANLFFCPVEYCERHTRGFPREYNMGDHISRVHRELDHKTFLKTTKRTGRKKSESISSGSTQKQAGPGVRKASSPKIRREKLEKQYRNSRTNVGKLFVKLPEPTNASSAIKFIAQLEAEVAKLKEASMGLQAIVITND